MSYTYAILDVSVGTFNEIQAKLKKAGYAQAFHRDGARTVIDMHGIALARLPIRPATNGPSDRRKTSWTPERRRRHSERMQQHAEMRRAMRE